MHLVIYFYDHPNIPFALLLCCIPWYLDFMSFSLMVYPEKGYMVGKMKSCKPKKKSFFYSATSFILYSGTEF